MREANCWVPLGPRRSIVTFPLSYTFHKILALLCSSMPLFPTPPHNAPRGKTQSVRTSSGGFRLDRGAQAKFSMPKLYLRKHTCEHLSDFYLVEWAFDQWAIVLWAFGRWVFLQCAYVRESRALVSFYRPSIVNFPLSLRVSDILLLLFFSMPLFPYFTSSLCVPNFPMFPWE